MLLYVLYQIKIQFTNRKSKEGNEEEYKNRRQGEHVKNNLVLQFYCTADRKILTTRMRKIPTHTEIK
jgi:hypothetical protein